MLEALGAIEPLAKAPRTVVKSPIRARGLRPRAVGLRGVLPAPERNRPVAPDAHGDAHVLEYTFGGRFRVSPIDPHAV